MPNYRHFDEAMTPTHCLMQGRTVITIAHRLNTIFKADQIIVLEGGRVIETGTLALTTLASFEAVAPLPLAAQMWTSSREAARRLFDVVDAEPAVKDNSSESSITKYELQISNLTFTYPSQNIPALRDITFTIPEGQSIAIVGPSGAGKSTIANLLLRSWDYESGEITLGGKSLKALNQDEVRKRCALVSQNNYFFNTTIRENLRLARPSMRWEEMESAARAAHIHEFIAGLPKSYDTFIGEQGLRLSGGGRQRLASHAHC